MIGMIDGDALFIVLFILLSYSIIKMLIEEYYFNKRWKNPCYKKLDPIEDICFKYNMKIEDLPQILEEYISYDNE